ncbi:OmpA family protein [Pseudomonas sp. NPDC007930]|uniref:OmpA family protein n=1 Tax=Pseudomonas sp. NPDC007930 TaxID=3364417 RepID=UPI0036E150EC
MRNYVLIPALLAASIALAACSTPPNQNLEQARSNFTSLQTNPKSPTLAALETKDAQDWLNKADAAYRNDDDTKKVDQLAYLANQRVEYAKQTIAMKSAEEELKNAASERAKAQLAARDAQIKKLQDSLNAKQTDRGTVVTFGDVLFDLNKSDLKAAGMNNVAQLAQFLRDNPERQLVVEGYTDSTGGDAYNQSLSERRANSVRAALVKMGVEPNRVIAQGYGKEYPVAENTSASGRAMNRRVEVTISNNNQPVAPRTH